MTLEQLIGQRLVFGISGKAVTDEVVRHFKETCCGGLILYRINFDSPDQIRRLITDLENALERRLLVCVDHEGGRVVMFGDGVTIFPSNQALGKTGNTAYARRQGEQEGRELRRLGIDVNLAPVLDVLTEGYSPNIGIRAYGEDPELVAKMGAARIAAMQVEGLSACAKHFPGLGPASLDPHLNLPTIQTSWEEMEKIHLVPFLRAMRTAVDAIMTSHPLYPLLDPTPRTPATFSRRIVREYLRQKTGYKGVIFSDDLEMGAIRELCPIGEAAVQTAQAGHDMILSCHDLNAQKQVFRGLLEVYQSKRLPVKDLEESVERVERLRAKRSDRFAPLPATPARAQREWDEAQALVKELCDQSVTVLKSGPPPEPKEATLVIAPRASSFKDRITIEKKMHEETAFFRERLEPAGLKVTLHMVAVEPSTAEIDAAAAAAGQAPQTILFLYDAHLHPSNKQLLEAVQKSSKRLVVVLLRDVYDAEWVRPDALTITNYGFRICDLEAVLRKLCAESTPHLPFGHPLPRGEGLG